MVEILNADYIGQPKKVRYRFGGARCDVFLDYFESVLYQRPRVDYIGNLWTEGDQRRKGHARGVLRMIADEADANHVILALVCAPHDSAIYQQIEDFYRSMGFVDLERLSNTFTGFPGYMIRMPQE